MHLVRGMSSLNTTKRKSKSKLTLGKIAKYEEQMRKHNKEMKRLGCPNLVMNIQEYIDYSYGKNTMLDPRDYRSFKPMQTQNNWRVEQDKDHREKYPSLMEQQMKSGTYKPSGTGMGKKEPMKYTGDLIQGIATMHKSNAVPVMKGTDQAKDIARMRRG